jgi:hypothetical protein
MNPFMFPPVRIVVTPPAREADEALPELSVHTRPDRVVQMLVEHDQAGNHGLPGGIDDAGVRRGRSSGAVAERDDAAVAKDDRLPLAHGAAGAIDDPGVDQRDNRGVHRHERLEGVGDGRALGRGGDDGEEREGDREAPPHCDTVKATACAPM